MSPKQDVSTERKNQIYQAALICFSRKGYFQTTMDDIVEESGLSKGALYWYFDSKKELFISLLQDILDPIGEEWNAIAADETRTATQKMQLLVAVFRNQFNEMVDIFGLVIEAWAQTHFDEDVQEVTRQFYKPYLALMSSIIREGVTSGEFQVENVEATTAIILTLYDGLTLAFGAGLLNQNHEVLLDAAETMVFRGLGVEV